jgi:hypothetical protein
MEFRLHIRLTIDLMELWYKREVDREMLELKYLPISCEQIIIYSQRKLGIFWTIFIV